MQNWPDFQVYGNKGAKKDFYRCKQEEPLFIIITNYAQWNKNNKGKYCVLLRDLINKLKWIINTINTLKRNFSIPQKKSSNIYRVT